MAEANWYWAEDGKQNGPVAGSAIVRLVADGKLGAEDLIWKEGMPQWVPVRRVSALVKYLKQPAAAPATPVAVLQPVAAATPVLTYQQGPIDPGAIHQHVPDPSGSVICPHCTVPNPDGGLFCESCGMALPTPNYGPRIVDNASFASTSVGQQLQSDELHKQAKKAAGALLAVAVIQTLVGGFIVAMTLTLPRAKPLLQNLVAIQVIALAVIFWGLFVWARRQPLPAAIVGLVLYVTMKVIDVAQAVAQGTIGNQQSGNGIGGTGISYLTIIIIVVLVRAISAGLKYRKMQGATGMTQG